MRKRGCAACSKRVQSIQPTQIQDQAGEQQQARVVSNVLQLLRQSSPCAVLSVQQLQRRGQAEKQVQGATDHGHAVEARQPKTVTCI